MSLTIACSCLLCFILSAGFPRCMLCCRLFIWQRKWKKSLSSCRSRIGDKGQQGNNHGPLLCFVPLFFASDPCLCCLPTRFYTELPNTLWPVPQRNILLSQGTSISTSKQHNYPHFTGAKTDTQTWSVWNMHAVCSQAMSAIHIHQKWGTERSRERRRKERH